MRNRLDAVRTPVPFPEIARALFAGWQRLEGAPASEETLAVLLAQSALETGHWQKSFCYNLGNAKASDSWSGDYCFYFADEYVSRSQAVAARGLLAPRTDGVIGHNVETRDTSDGRVRVILWPDHPWCRFRAFRDLDSGVDDYLGLLKRRYAVAWDAAGRGDPDGFVRGLKQGGYFTGGLEAYLDAVGRLFGKFSGRLLAETDLFSQSGLPVPVGTRPLLVAGATGGFVREMQTILVQAGYADVEVTGVFDEQTRRAVVLFQMQHIDAKGRPLAQDGKIGPNTWWALLNNSGDAQRSALAPPPTGGLTPGRQKVIEIALGERAKDVRERPDGSNGGPEVDEYLRPGGVLKQPWCCAFVSWVLERALDRLPIDGTYHIGVQKMWLAAEKAGLGTTEPKPGDLFIQIKDKGTGHTGFVVGISEDGQAIHTCEGNCGNRVKLGQRHRSTIHHFIDCLRDGQGPDFARGSNLSFDDVEDDGTR